MQVRHNNYDLASESGLGEAYHIKQVHPGVPRLSVCVCVCVGECV